MDGFMKRLNWQIWAGFVLSLVAGQVGQKAPDFTLTDWK